MFSRAFQQPFSPAFDRGGVLAGNGLLTSLIGYWPCNEAAGANDVLDLHTNGLTLTQVHSPDSAAGLVYAGARTGDGAADYAYRAHETLLTTGDIDFSFAVWIYPTSAASMLVAGKHLPTTNREWALFYNPSGTCSFQISPNGSTPVYLATTTATYGINAWHLMVGWHDSVGNTINISIDDATPISVSHTTGVYSSSSAELRFMVNGNNNSWYIGRMGPVMFWKKVLPAGQRTALYNAGAGLAYASFTS